MSGTSCTAAVTLQLDIPVYKIQRQFCTESGLRICQWTVSMSKNHSIDKWLKQKRREDGSNAPRSWQRSMARFRVSQFHTNFTLDLVCHRYFQIFMTLQLFRAAQRLTFFHSALLTSPQLRAIFAHYVANVLNFETLHFSIIRVSRWNVSHNWINFKNVISPFPHMCRISNSSIHRFRSFFVQCTMSGNTDVDVDSNFRLNCAIDWLVFHLIFASHNNQDGWRAHN